MMNLQEHVAFIEFYQYIVEGSVDGIDLGYHSTSVWIQKVNRVSEDGTRTSGNASQTQHLLWTPPWEEISYSQSSYFRLVHDHLRVYPEASGKPDLDFTYNVPFGSNLNQRLPCQA